MVFGLSWGELVTIIASIIAVMGFFRVLVKEYISAQKSSKMTIIEKDVSSVKFSLTQLQQQLQDELNEAKLSQHAITEDLKQIQLKLADSAIDVRIETLEKNNEELKLHHTRLQDKLEKVTDLTIQILRSKE